MIDAVAHNLNMWPPDLKAKIHSRWELLDYLAGCQLRNRRREEGDEQQRIQQQAAEARAGLRVMR